MLSMVKYALVSHAKNEHPKECCGLLLTDGSYLPCENIAVNPYSNFEIDLEIIEAYAPMIEAIYHSHPDGEFALSTHDRQQQLATNIKWVLVQGWGVREYRPCEPLLGRKFEHGKFDCYTLFRDAYMLSGVDFPDFDRNDDWWYNGDNLYLDNMEKHGFERVESPQLGDIILMNIQASVPNHCGIYLGEQMMLHHIANRLSKRDVYGGYWHKHTHSIWRYKKWQELNYMGILNDLAMSSS